MKIAIGLPATVPGATGDEVLEWARRAESAGFSSAGIIDRLIFDNYEPLVTLAAVAGATSTLGLITSILIAPLRGNELEVAKQALSIDALSGGRLTLGVGLGSRDDDYELSGLPTSGRGTTLDRQLERIRRVWSGDSRFPEAAIGPRPVRPGGPQVLVAGHTPASFERVARFGDGWIYGRSSPQEFAELAGEADAAWAATGRPGSPLKVSQGYYALGPDAREMADRYLLDYYAWLGPVAEYVAADALCDPDAVHEYLDRHAEAGCDELILFPCGTGIDQLERLEDALAGRLS